MKTLLTGPDGQIGHELLATMPQIYASQVVTLSIDQLDFADSAGIRRWVQQIKPNLIINAAGYTAVDRAESEPEVAMAINATAVGVLGEEAAKLGAAVVHFSTDYVFDGRKTTPYTPDDPPNPLSAYARSKLEGEIALIKSGAAHLIIRTEWIYGLRGRNFLLAMLENAAKPELRIVADQIGCPTWCRAVAQATFEIINKSVTFDPSSKSWSFGGREGIYHLCSSGSTSWFDFARCIFDLAAIGPRPALVPITTEQYGAKAQRPKYSVMDCSRTTETFGVSMADWNVALREALAERSGDKPAETVTR
jgi:dTDP-4-dehydrorhamnose reductase